MAANQAYLSGLGLSPSAMQSGLIAPLPPDHIAMVTAARQSANQAAITRAEHQVGETYVHAVHYESQDSAFALTGYDGMLGTCYWRLTTGR